MYITPQTTISPLQITQNRVKLAAYPSIYNGFINGFTQPSARLTVHIRDVDTVHFSHLQVALKHYFKQYPYRQREMTTIRELTETVGECLCAIQKASYLPVFDEIKIQAHETKPHEFRLWIPILNGSYLQPIVHLILAIFNTHLAAEPIPPLAEIELKLAAMLRTLQTYAPQGSNSLFFLKAAHDENIPWMHVALNTYQYGYGRLSRWLDSSFTDQTSHIAAIIARDKCALRTLLQKAGFPVTEQYTVQSAQEAVNTARQTGFPVVIKPRDKDGGIGVSANLASDGSVVKAFEKARQCSSHILLEKHVPGKNYRLQVFEGSLIWAVERFPAGVMGDGVHTIAELLQTSAISITEEILDYLAEQDMPPSSVLLENQFVAVSRIANITSGGAPLDVFDQVHADNRQLAETAARLLRLDFAGIDFISPDISRSWREIGGTIIEMNSQPLLGFSSVSHLYHQVLKSLLPDRGRIPIIVVAGKLIHDEQLNQLMKNYQHEDARVGLVKDDIAYVNKVQVHHAENNYQAGLHLLFSKEVDALIYCISKHEDFSREGLPFDRYNHLYLTDAEFSGQLDVITSACCGDISCLKLYAFG